MEGDVMNLTNAQEGKEYIVSRIDTDDEELDAFLFSLGCYSGEPITVIAHRKHGCVIAVKDGRYNIDTQLAEAIIIEE
jgi:ferrous iron transport protein A